MPQGLIWDRDGRHWPHREHSRFVEAGGIRWHLQQWTPPRPGAPTLLLLHGSGASTHSWRALIPLLAAHGGVLALDLPGHGYSSAAAGDGASIEGVARSVAALLHKLGAAPDWWIGHSAGAAIAIRMALQAAAQGQAGPRGVVGLNAALFPLPGLAGSLFAPAAKLLALNPLVPHLFARRARRPSVVRRLLDSTGSHIDAEGTALYTQLVTNPGHVAGALQMMARWDLPALAADLPRLRLPPHPPLHLLVGGSDRTVPPGDAGRVQALVPATTVQVLAGLGHLAHEEQPQVVAAALLPWLTPQTRGS